MSQSPQPMQESDLIFPSASSSISATLKSLKRSNLTITNRLQSIGHDAKFVVEVADTLTVPGRGRLPLVANERCGSWYILPDRKGGSAYFKSTDGHFSIWDFSLRRLNLQVLDIVGEHGGCIIVDSTRKGKSMPDALSKTVPIWITVLNRALFPDDERACQLSTPQDVVSPSEHAQIEQRLNSHVEALRRLHLELDELRSKLQRPMQPVWVTPDTILGEIQMPSMKHNANPIVLCTASSRFSRELVEDPNYVQGAADDSEAWACGLDASTFWRHNTKLLATAEDDLPEMIRTLLADNAETFSARHRNLIRPTSTVWISDNASLATECDGMDVVIHCAPEADQACMIDLARRGAKYINVACGTGKTGSRKLRTELSRLDVLAEDSIAKSKILIVDPSGKDIAVGVALAIICLHCKDDGMILTASDKIQRRPINKDLIKQRLSWIMASMPDASPSRATLQSVNAFLMG